LQYINSVLSPSQRWYTVSVQQEEIQRKGLYQFQNNCRGNIVDWSKEGFADTTVMSLHCLGGKSQQRLWNSVSQQRRD